MIVTKKAISRRTVLRGIGTAVALPLLDAMVPALTAAAQTPAKAVRRLGVVYHPNGIIYDKWLPRGAGAGFEFSPVLSPLEPFREKLVVVTGLYSDQAEALGDGGGDHSRASGTYLTGVHVKRSDTIVENGIDNPNANTLIVDGADKLGLAQLYQLRGRVGRSDRQAYAYLLYRSGKKLTDQAMARRRFGLSLNGALLLLKPT